mmetsp:Transcript_32765/g.45770  ORF Transcript_32765/g.45770 Transcript_32765/m.45770 type:complete len:228 (-) Transcript_32765:413-1096(-)
MSMTLRRLWNSGSRPAPAMSSSKQSSPSLFASILSKSFCRYFLSSSSSYSSSSARFTISRSRASANMSMTTATIKFSTPKTNVKSDRTNMIAVSGCFKISGTAMRPQLSPAITVWNSSRFARITEEVASKHRSPQLAKSGLSFISGCSISTINIAHRVMITKHRRNDQSKALKQVVIMVASFCSSFKERLFRSSRISLLMRTKRRARRRLIAPTSSGVRKFAITISA